MSSYLLLLEMTIVLGVWLCLAISQKDPGTPGRRTFILAILAWMAWCFGEFAGERGLLPQSTANLPLQLGALAFAPLWLGVAAQTARLEIARRIPWFPVPLLAPGVCVFAVLFSDTWRGLYLVIGENGAEVHGPLWGIMVIYGFTLALIGSGILVAAAVRWHQPGEGARRLAIGIAPFITLPASALYFGGVWRSNIDPTPLLLGVTLFVLHRAIFAGGLLQALSLSQHALVQQFPLGVVLTDRGGVVVDVNPVAERRLGVSASEAVGRNFDAVIDTADADLRFEVTPVMSAGTEAGQIVLLDPPHKQQPTARDFVAQANSRDDSAPAG
jgi:PAS domain-containing protein